MAHKLPEVACHLSGFELVPPNAPGLPHSCQDRQYDSGDGLHKPQGGMWSYRMWLLVQCILLWVQNKFLYLREVYVPGVTHLSADFLLRHSLEFGECRLHLSGGRSVRFQRESLLSSVLPDEPAISKTRCPDSGMAGAAPGPPRCGFWSWLLSLIKRSLGVLRAPFTRRLYALKW